MFNWSVEAISDLKRLHEQGASFSEIAGLIGCASRNAVIGKAGRLGLLGGRRQKQRMKRAQEFQHSVKRMRRAPLNKGKIFVVMADPVIAQKPEAIDASNALNLSLLDLTAETCRFPFGTEAPFLFCGHPTIEGSSYCGHHKLICTGAGTVSERTAATLSTKMLEAA